MMSSATGRPTEQQHKQQQQQQQQQQHQQHQQQNQQYGKKTSLVTAAALADAHVERDRKPKVLLHELAAQKYSLFLAESPGLGHLPPLSYYRRPRRKRQRPDMTKALVTLRVPGAPLDGSHTLHFTSEWRKPMTIEPEQLGAFYKPGDGVIEPTLQPPPDLRMGGIQGKDLNHGYLNYVEPDTTSSTSEIAEMLDETPGLEREEESAHFITYRNNLNKIMVTPYSKQKWEIEVFKEGGVIYLEVVMTDRNKGKMDRTSYWGRRFETLCVLGVEGARLDELQRGPDDPPRPSYCALYRSRIGNHNVLMGAEIDACRPSDPGRFVEIKTTRVIHNPKDEQIFKKHKTLKYWAQCYLAGVRDLVVGYRDDHGIVRDVKTWTTDALVDSVDKVKHWDKDVCLNFTDRVLSFLKDNVDEGPRYSMKLLDPYDQITLEQIASPSTPTAPGAVGGSLYAER
eukprot:jgi/Undpi1/8793/HiC_scaffold_25.g11255.m1